MSPTPQEAPPHDRNEFNYKINSQVCSSLIRCWPMRNESASLLSLRGAIFHLLFTVSPNECTEMKQTLNFPEETPGLSRVCIRGLGYELC